MVPNTPNVLRAYEAAGERHIREGMDWYHNAHCLAVSLDGNVKRAAGIIAALSPMVSWARNVELAGRAYAEGKASGTFGFGCRAADAILAGADPLNVLHGWKVRAFYTLIADPDDEHTVCVDRHAIDVAVGRRLAGRDRRRRYPLRNARQYERFARCYRRAAVQLGVTPAQVQATTWVAWRHAITI